MSNSVRFPPFWPLKNYAGSLAQGHARRCHPCPVDVLQKRAGLFRPIRRHHAGSSELGVHVSVRVVMPVAQGHQGLAFLLWGLVSGVPLAPQHTTDLDAVLVLYQVAIHQVALVVDTRGCSRGGLLVFEATGRRVSIHTNLDVKVLSPREPTNALHPLVLPPLPRPERKERFALHCLHKSTNGSEWTCDQGWSDVLKGKLSSVYGVSVENGRVTKISLGANNMEGEYSRAR